MDFNFAMDLTFFMVQLVQKFVLMGYPCPITGVELEDNQEWVRVTFDPNLFVKASLASYRAQALGYINWGGAHTSNQ
jgi:hypothetical protein